MGQQRYVAFWSYTRFDDKNDGRWLSALREGLENEVRALSGKAVEIFQDVEGLLWGEQWREKLQLAGENAVFLVPVITPSYFTSNSCRSELEQFLQRERETDFSELILPLYYITCPKLEEPFAKAADWLAQAIAEHNYKDIRHYRHDNIESPGVRQMIKARAEELIQRITRMAQRHLTSPQMKARITFPVPHAHVPNRALVLGTVEHGSEWCEIWLVVETGSVYHPQMLVSRAANTWQSIVAIGGSQPGSNLNCEFPLHVLAVTEDVSASFQQYLADAKRRKIWTGVPKPTESRILNTLILVRDDSSWMFHFMEGAYDEFRKDGTRTGGIINLTRNGDERFKTEARNSSGEMVWTGSIRMIAVSHPLRGEGFYTYVEKPDSGDHIIVFDTVTGNLNVEGRNTSHSGLATFEMIWKRRR